MGCRRDSLIKLHLDDSVRQLYRGHYQGHFERTVLESVRTGLGFSYWGIERSDNEKLTFCTPCPDTAIVYAVYWMDKRPTHFDLELFPAFPLVMCIEADKYRERLVDTGQGDGLAITGPIDLDDVTVLYSTQIDLLDRFPEIPKHIRKLRLSAAHACEEKIASRDDFLTLLEKDQKAVLMNLHTLMYGYRGDPEDLGQRQTIMRFLDAIRAKLR